MNKQPETQTIRPSALAGTWYPDGSEALAENVENLLEQRPPRIAGEVIALIEPHAGYQYSGPSAAVGYRLVRSRNYQRILVLAPTHYVGFSGFSIPEVTHFQTPLGLIPLDGEACKSLRNHPLHVSVPEAHEPEHSIEIQVPFIQTCIPGIPMLPILIGNLERSDYPVFAKALQPWVGKDTLIVASSDFTHQGPRFGYQPFSENLEQQIRELDLGALEPIAKLDPDGFLDYQERTGITICGFRPIALLLHLLKGNPLCKALDYSTSAEVTGDWVNSVSYLTIAFQKPDPPPAQQPEILRPKAQRLALKMARDAIAAHLENEAPTTPVEPISPGLGQQGTCFVTLRKGPALRGCIGNLRFAQPLAQTIQENAVHAAFGDPRFEPLKPQELPEVHLEISVLTPPEPVASPESIELGLHGVILEHYGRRAVFLPQVAVEQIWTREELLENLCTKAGLPPNAWHNAKLQVFCSQVFTEADLFHQDQAETPAGDETGA